MREYIIIGVAGKPKSSVKGDVIIKKKTIDTEFGSIMILVPHQDDEIILCAGVIMSALKEQLPLCVVMATNGDYGSEGRSIGCARLRETLAGLALLGVDEKNVIFMGYADTGMPVRQSFLARLQRAADGNAANPSHCSCHSYALPEKPDWHTQKHGCPAPYTRNSFTADLLEIIEEHRPCNIFTTSPFDAHGDHSALHLLLKEVLSKIDNYSPAIYSGLAHAACGDELWPPREDELFSPPPDFGGNWEDSVCFEVPDLQLKRRALSMYKTALAPDAVDYLYSFVKPQELFICEL